MAHQVHYNLTLTEPGHYIFQSTTAWWAGTHQAPSPFATTGAPAFFSPASAPTFAPVAAPVFVH
ncbi:hypothetical protein FA95DRAFT_1612999 [Auriscalpium vulgare]|uniref:Uncharacterized protein n=1 Tax=Auriscalpium vulgare TaxID=40419 RepID=A0ACB8R474_9AGAM|nr:hypothetical protein FA95DRAFT_1612999 [Auriscalpium vulgare]